MNSSCPICQHPIEGWPDQCPTCRRWIKPLRPKVPVPWRFDLLSILLTVAVIALGLGLSIGGNTILLGVPILLIAPATILRATPIIVHRRLNGKPTEAPDVYLESCLVAGLMAGIAVVTTVAVFVPVFVAVVLIYGIKSQVDPSWPLPVGLLVVGYVLYRLARVIIRPKD